MSETISQLPVGVIGFLSDLVPLTQGSTGPGTGTSRKLNSARVLSSNGGSSGYAAPVYAGDPAFGVVANGSTDDTSAWTAALQYASAIGSWVVAPIGVSKVSSITVPSNTGILGQNVECISVTNGQGSTTLGSVISSNSSTLPTIIMAPNSRMQDIQIQGNVAQDCVQFNTSSVGSIHIDNVDIFGGLNGINGNSSAASLILAHCRIHENTNGILNVVDANIVHNNIDNNTTAGINLGAGCARIVITGNKIVKNGTNIRFVGTSTSFVSNVAVTGNVMYDSNANNVLLTYCHNIVIGANSIGCAARSQGSSPGTALDANFQMGNCTGVLINGNSTWVGTDITSYTGPFYAIYDAGANINCQITCNILPYVNNATTAGSATSGPINTTATFNLASSLNTTYWTNVN